MSVSIFLNSNEGILFIILTIVPFAFYFFWKLGYNFRILKIPIFLSIISAFYFFITSNNYIFTFEDSLKSVLEKLLLLNLLFLSTIFTLIILIVPYKQNITKTTQSISVKKDKSIFTSNLEWNDNKVKNNSSEIRNKYREDYLILDDLNMSSERNSQKLLDDKFQKLINHLFKNQNKNYSRSES